MNGPKRQLAFIAYLVPVFGWLYVLLFEKKDRFAIYHAKQSMVLTIAAVATPLIWAVVAWVLALVPFVGPILASALFALVILIYLSLAVVWIVGMVNALQALVKPLPLIGGWAERISIGG